MNDDDDEAGDAQNGKCQHYHGHASVIFNNGGRCFFVTVCL